ncbi:putative arabinan endo-1,5-alpha-L-arabinosidase A [Lachnellula arida]|uniref:Arabinan endo-1,5-alpha-L-arabinosidase n=1 Tax=Lachnellula arida TaxID=1316785 RepID=A0A8T9BAZ9_9HELO|nr:putative arabinan endo-1,5-alpha-L-arabinosidase A [Lachnellula arida]
MFSLLRFATAFLIATASLVQGYADPGACSGACWAHDPSIIQRSSDELYFKFNTGSGIEIATASSLSGPWTLEGYALTNGSKIDLTGNTDLWAPDVHKVGDLYYMYYAVSTSGSQVSAIGLATSSTLEVGSWTDLGATGIASTSAKPYNAIDPNLIEVDSEYYLTFGSFWHDIYQAPMSSDAKTVASSSVNIEYNSTGTHPSEGSYMFYYSGYYYLLWSSGICCGFDTSKPATGAEYKIMMCRSTSFDSGFVDQSGVACTSNGGTVLLASHGTTYGPGGQQVFPSLLCHQELIRLNRGVFTDSSKGLVLYYHYADTSVGMGDGSYLFGWNVLGWSDGWPTV